MFDIDDDEVLVEMIPRGRVTHQTEKAQTYLCPDCQACIFSAHEGDDDPLECICEFPAGHTLVFKKPQNC